MTTPMGTAAQQANNVVNVDTTQADKVGVFTTAQSLVTFPGAVAAVTTIWTVLGTIRPELGSGNKTVPVVLAVAVGAIIYLTSVTQGPRGWRRRLGEVSIALVNSFTIAAAALGIGT